MWQLGPGTNGPDNLRVPPRIFSLSLSAIRGSAKWRALRLGKGWGLRGRLSPSKHLIPTFVFLARKTKACLEREGALSTERRREPAAWQTLWIRFQRLRPTPSPSVVICVRGSVTLFQHQTARGNRPSSEDSGQRGSLRQRRWFLSAGLPAAP